MESFNRSEHVIAAFLDAEKAFDSSWHNGFLGMDSGTKITSFVDGSPIFLLEESYMSKLKVSCLQKSTQKQVSYKVPTWLHYFSLSMLMTCQIQITIRLTSHNLLMT